MKRRRSPIAALASIAGALAATALVGARVTRRNLGWYHQLRRPAWTPPDAAFGPVWTGLYALMGVSAWRVWRARSSPTRTRALGLWAAQLGLNALWSPLFFGAHKLRPALANIGQNLAAATAYAVVAHRVDRPAGWLMAPYLAWTAYAGALNADIVLKNPRPIPPGRN